MDTAVRKGRRDPEKEKFWREAVRQQAASGEPVRKYCTENGLKENMFYGWRRELKLRDSERAGEKGFIELIRRGGQGGTAGVSIRVGERMSIVVERDFDEQTLKAVLAAVGA